MTDHIEIDVSDGILTLRLNRPEKKNALTRDMYHTLVEGFDQAADDPQVRVILLTGNGGAFTSGNDIGDFLTFRPKDDTAPVLLFLSRLGQCRKPLVMGVNGIAIGVGVTMLLHADFVIASDNSSFQLPFVNLGLVPEAASSLLLPHVAGHKLASELLLLGERFDVTKAFAAGLITRVVPSDQVDATALEIAQKLAAKPPEALALSKALIKDEWYEAISLRMKKEGAIFLDRLASPEAMAAFTAFINRGKG